MVIQPSELARLAAVLVLAAYFQRRDQTEPYRLHQLVIPVGLALIPALLILKEPDLGTCIFGALGGRKRHPDQRGKAPGPGHRRRRPGGGPAPGLALYEGLPEEAHLQLPGSGERSPGRGLPPHPIQDSGGLGPVHGQGLFGRHPEPAALFTRAAHRLRLFGVGRGVGLYRRHGGLVLGGGHSLPGASPPPTGPRTAKACSWWWAARP